jgi:HK97 family phage major capsid protein
MPNLGAGAKPVIYGDLSMYYIQEVDTIDIRCLKERYADYGQVAVGAMLHTDGNLADVNAVKHLLMAT